VTRALIIVALLGGVAHAQEAPAPASPPRPQWSWSLGVLLRDTSEDPNVDGDLAALDAYGWHSNAPTMSGLRGDLAYLQAPIVDLGLAWSYASGTFANGARGGLDPDQIDASSTELGVLARVHWGRPDASVAAEPRLELGLARTRVDLREVTDSALGTYFKIGVDARIGTPKAGLMVSLAYVSTHADTMLELPTGGLDFGISFVWRQF